MRPYRVSKFSAAELMKKRLPPCSVGPSSKTWPRWDLLRRQNLFPLLFSLRQVLVVLDDGHTLELHGNLYAVVVFRQAGRVVYFEHQRSHGTRRLRGKRKLGGKRNPVLGHPIAVPARRISPPDIQEETHGKRG